MPRIKAVLCEAIRAICAIRGQEIGRIENLATFRVSKLPILSGHRNQNGNPTEKCSVPPGSRARGFRLRAYSSRTGPISV